MQDIEGGYDKKLAEELAEVNRAQEVLVARFAHEEAMLKKSEEEAEQAETLKELYRSEFEQGRAAIGPEREREMLIKIFKRSLMI